MSFVEDVPNFKTLINSQFHMADAPENTWDKLEAYAYKSAQKNGLIGIVNRLNALILKPPTKNWGHDFLVYDLSETINDIKNIVLGGKFQTLMDAFLICLEYGIMDINELNEFLYECKLGYVLQCDSLYYPKFHWIIRGVMDDLTKTIVDTETAILESETTIFQQAIDHFRQAKKQFEDSTNERARKDAVRDCASAMEAIVKICGAENDIRGATKKLREDQRWGKEEIIKDGDGIFNTIHRLYPDVRHGSTERSEMTLNEARYWIDRISSYVQFIIRQYDEVSNNPFI